MEKLQEVALKNLTASLEKHCTTENFNKACRWILSHPEAHPYVFAGAAVVVMGLSLYDSVAIGEANHKLFLERIESIQQMKNNDDKEKQFELLQKQLVLWKRERQFRGATKIALGIGFFVMAISAVVSPIIRLVVGSSGTVTAGAGAYDLYQAYDSELFQDFESMLRRKGYFKYE